MSDSLNNEQREQLLTAYFDNELGPEGRAQVELFLADNSVDAQMLQKWRENGNAIRELPRYSLDEGFADRVMIAAGVSADPSEVQQAHEVAVQKLAEIATEKNNWRIGVGAIATLAAMLMLTLFVFPGMMDSKVAVNQPEITKPDIAKPEIEKPGVANPVDDKDPTNTINAVEATGTGNKTIRRPVIGSRNSSLPGKGKNGRPVDPIVFSNATGPNIEQVLWVENKSLADLEMLLANHSIKILDPNGGIGNPGHLVPMSTDGVEALLVVSTADQMKQAIAEISSAANCSVRAFPLPARFLDAASLSTEKAKPENGSAQQIEPLDLHSKGTDANEIASLDRWFGLIDDADDSRMIRFLLLLNAPTQTGSNSTND